MVFISLILRFGLDYKRYEVVGEMFLRVISFFFFLCDWKSFMEEKIFESNFKRREECEGRNLF